MPFKIIRNDITKVKADAIVNTANPQPRIGRGTDSAIYNAAGPDRLLEDRRKIGVLSPGQCASTDAYNLNAKYIIHTVGPAWQDGQHGETGILRACYENSLRLAHELGCTSIAFPLIASGVYGFPKGEALNIALSEIGKFLLTHDITVILVVFDRKALELSESLIGGVEQYIDETMAHQLRNQEYGNSYSDDRRQRRVQDYADESAILGDILAGEADEANCNCSTIDLSLQFQVPEEEPSEKSLDDLLNTPAETFQQRLFQLIDSSGMDDVTVYKKANIDRKVFSRIRCKADYKPKKRTALAFAIALELDMATTLDLLSRAEIAFSPSNKFDLIITYFISHKVYDIYEINAVLFKYGQPILGE